MNEQHEDRIADLIDELMDHPEEQFMSGHMMRTWAEKCIEHEEEEWFRMVAFLGVAADLMPACSKGEMPSLATFMAT